MRISIKEVTFAGKASFQIWAAKFGVKTNIYHTDNRRFVEQNFISEIEDYNQTRIFCGVGSHHQNATAERKIQTLTLGDRTFLIHEKYIGYM